MFTGSHLQAGGYGQVSATPIDGKRQPPLRAHRVVWEHHNGPITSDLIVMHSCDNPPCVRIEHLSLGTYSMNLQDAIDKGRHCAPVGARRGRLTPETIAAIRAAPTGEAASVATGVSRSHVSRIRRGLVY